MERKCSSPLGNLKEVAIPIFFGFPAFAPAASYNILAIVEAEIRLPPTVLKSVTLTAAGNRPSFFHLDENPPPSSAYSNKTESIS